jgi:3'-phosphoadenosine 5'-phosphosulfate sulfotransferase (PAPS reductase)/FAD synthetase
MIRSDAVDSDALFRSAELYRGDPLDPDLETVTPAVIVAELSPADRERRVDALVAQRDAIIDDALRLHLRGRTLAATCLLWSGGNDSNGLAALVRDRVTHVVMANTGVGIEETRQHVRDHAAAWGLPLVEERAGDTFRRLVLGELAGWSGGFPGPAGHATTYARLKERLFDRARHTMGYANSRTKAALWLAGRRRAESERRADVPEHQSDGTVIWASPLVMWTRFDRNTYRARLGDAFPANPVADLLHMSGECLCGAYAGVGELDLVGEHFPDAVAPIRELEVEARTAGIPEPWCRWGWGATRRDGERGSMPRPGNPAARNIVCGGCEHPTLFDGATA